MVWAMSKNMTQIWETCAFMYEKHTHTHTHTQTKDQKINFLMNKPWRWTELQLWQIVFIWRRFWCENCKIKLCLLEARYIIGFLLYTHCSNLCVRLHVWGFFSFVKALYQSSVLSSSSSPPPSLETAHSIQWLRLVAYIHMYIVELVRFTFTHSLHLKPPKLINSIEVNNTSSFFNGKCSLVASVFFIAQLSECSARIFFSILRPLWETDNKMSQNSENYDLVYIMLTVFCGLNGWLPVSQILKCVCVKDNNNPCLWREKNARKLRRKVKKFSNK